MSYQPTSLSRRRLLTVPLALSAAGLLVPSVASAVFWQSPVRPTHTRVLSPQQAPDLRVRYRGHAYVVNPHGSNHFLVRLELDNFTGRDIEWLAVDMDFMDVQGQRAMLHPFTAQLRLPNNSTTVHDWRFVAVGKKHSTEKLKALPPELTRLHASVAALVFSDGLGVMVR